MAGAGAAVAGIAAGPLLAQGQADARQRGESAQPERADGRRSSLAHRGVCYEIADGETPHTGWEAHRMREDLRVIKEELHATSVQIWGSGVERLSATAREAAERGLAVWLQPRLGDCPEREILEHLAAAGEEAERLRRQGARVHLSVGCEFWLYVPGIVPGDDALERVRNMLDGNYDREKTQRRLDRFIPRAARTGRSVFDGRLTYAAAAPEDKVDWSLFDIVSLDYYAYHRRRADYVRDLEPFRRWGKPVAIAEFGCCTYKGAARDGGMGWYSVDFEKNPPEIKGDLRRSEREQARYLSHSLAVFEALGLYAAMAFSFVSPDAPHRPERRYDMDMASYGLVKSIWKTRDKPTPAWHWERKEGFHAVAAHFAHAAGRARP
nr:abortive phage infection protein [Streptomyces boncukensis]